jgi:hypothetical protein
LAPKFVLQQTRQGDADQELESHGVLNNGNQINYAMGLSLLDYRSLAAVEHIGALFGYRTTFLRFPSAIQRHRAV